MAFDFLLEPLLTWRDRAYVEHRSTLPGVLAELMQDTLEDFPCVRAHQLDAWMMFLTQLAAIAVARAEHSDAPATEDEWLRLLEALTDGRHEPWSLVVEDLSLPALMQSPVPEGHLRDWRVAGSADDIDVLVTTKCHDVKRGILDRAHPECWLFALITLQTMQGYPGRGYTPVSRMKGGYGSRARVGMSPGGSLGSQFARDLRVLRDATPDLLHRGLSAAGVALVWLEPWTGDDSIPWHTLAPHFIEVCRRIRLQVDERAIFARYTTNTARRCAPDIDTGDVGDAWIPIEREDGGALTIGGRGFHYPILVELLSGGRFEPSAALRVRADDPPVLVLHAGVLARGQGMTDGLHERRIPIDGRVRRRLSSTDGRARFGERGRAFVERAAAMRTKVLYPALKALSLDKDPMPDTFDAEVDRVFFDHLFASVDDELVEAVAGWSAALAALAHTQLAVAIARTPTPSFRSYAAAANAELVFARTLRKHFPELSPSTASNAPGTANA
jgi:CRISPR system Cascade subunit CasA